MDHNSNKMDEHNFSAKVYQWRDRQAGVSMIYDPARELFTYNAYCLELKLLTELFTEEFDALTDALNRINEEFGQWPLVDVAVAAGISAGCAGGCSKGGCCRNVDNAKE